MSHGAIEGSTKQLLNFFENLQSFCSGVVTRKKACHCFEGIANAMQKNPENEYGPIDNTRLEKYMKIFRENGFKIPRACMTDDHESVPQLKTK